MSEEEYTNLTVTDFTLLIKTGGGKAGKKRKAELITLAKSLGLAPETSSRKKTLSKRSKSRKKGVD